MEYIGDTLSISYRIRLAKYVVKDFDIQLDKDTLLMHTRADAARPAWAELGKSRCPNCTLDPSAHSHCPSAVNLVELIDYLKDITSYKKVEVSVVFRDRTYLKNTTIQSVASSLMGIIMVSSGCPVLDKLRPMVETHLPFSFWDETTYRIVSMYLFAQYFLYKSGEAPDWDLAGLVKLLDDVETVNRSFCDRLDMVRSEDSCVNAVSILNLKGSMAKFSIIEDELTHWRDIFLRHYVKTAM
ncbi:MAG: hypothetical protein HZA22_03040 [Nitrospirae bacterium]|nr:hypothetical protein [Nitrospirota bacterium]